MFHVSCFMFTDEIAEHNQTESHEQMVIIASEPLTDEDDFKEIPPNRIPTIQLSYLNFIPFVLF